MKRNTARISKARKLARALGVPRYSAVGLLELLWHATAQLTPRGDIGTLDDDHIAEELFWDGDPAGLVRALITTGWIDPCKKHRLVVHDWHDHADQTVRRTKAVQDQGFATPLVGDESEASLMLVGNKHFSSVPGSGNREPGTGSRDPSAPSGADHHPRGETSGAGGATSEPGPALEIDGVRFTGAELELIDALWDLWPANVREGSTREDVAKWIALRRPEVVALKIPESKRAAKLVYWTRDAIEQSQLGAQVDRAEREWRYRHPLPLARAPDDAVELPPELTPERMASVYRDGYDRGDD